MIILMHNVTRHSMQLVAKARRRHFYNATYKNSSAATCMQQQPPGIVNKVLQKLKNRNSPLISVSNKTDQIYKHHQNISV